MPIVAMRPSNHRGGSERRFIPQGSRFSELNHDFEELCSENGQLLVVIPSQNGKVHKQPPAGLSIPSQSPKDTARQIAMNKDVTLEALLNDAERLTEFPACVHGVDMVDWLDDPLVEPLDGESTIVTSSVSPSSMPPALTSPVFNHSVGRMSPLGFPQTSEQAVAMREGLQRVGTTYRPSALVTPKEFDKADAEVAMPLVSSMHLRKCIPEDEDALLSSSVPQCMTSSSIMQSLQDTHFTQKTGATVFFDGSPTACNAKTSAAPSCVNPRASMDISPASDLESVLLEASEPTGISFSCGSGHGPNKGDKISCGKRKTDAMNDFDCESEDSYDDAVVARKTQQERSASTKRTRAAETHNQSERKRRGRINEKLKALQELIPNANKTDKASLLSEAIDYLKKLRLQLQVMSYRSGMSVSPLLISQGLHHLQMPHGGMGLNFETTMGMGAGESATSTSFQSVPMPSNVGPTAPFVSAQICPGSTGPHVVQASLQDPFVSTSPHFPLVPTAIPHPLLGSTDLSRSVSFHHPSHV